MKILKHGTLKERKFVCKVCGCEFVANANEYYAYTASCITLWYNADCPECHNDTNVSEPWEDEND